MSQRPTVDPVNLAISMIVSALAVCAMMLASCETLPHPTPDKHGWSTPRIQIQGHPPLRTEKQSI